MSLFVKRAARQFWEVVESEQRAEAERVAAKYFNRGTEKMVGFDGLTPQAAPTVRSKDLGGEKESESMNEPGLRRDAGKPRWDLLPADALLELVNVYTKGAEKYADRNWEKGMSWHRCFRPLLSHAFKFWSGRSFDTEGPGATGCHHMAMVAWNALALCAYDLRQVGTDDRPIERP